MEWRSPRPLFLSTTNGEPSSAGPPVRDDIALLDAYSRAVTAGRRIDGIDDLLRLLIEDQIGEITPVAVLRADALIYLTVVPEEKTY